MSNDNTFIPNNGTGQGYATEADYEANLARLNVTPAASTTPVSTAATRAEAAAGLAAPASVSTVRPVNATADVATEVDIAKQAAFNDVMSKLRDAGSDLSSPTEQRGPSMIYDGATGNVTITDAGQITPPGAEPARIYDDNRNLEAEHAAIVKDVLAMQAKLDANSFNAVTGEKVYSLTGQAREQLQTQLGRAKDSANLSISALRMIGAQRSADAAKLAANNNEQIARAAFSSGDKGKQELLDKMIAEEEARELAKSIIRARAAGRR